MRKSIPARWLRKKNFTYYKSSWNSWRALPRAIEPDDVNRLLRKRFTPRDKCMILILLRTGMRICELLALKPNDINLRQRMIVILASAKTGMARAVYISDDAYTSIKKWMKQRDPAKNFLFYSRHRQNMSYGAARSIFIKCLRKTHLIRKRYTLHCLRHTFASEMLSAGMPLESLQVLMGHSTVEVTRRYARLTNKALENDYFKSMQIIERGEIDGSYRNDIQL